LLGGSKNNGGEEGKKPVKHIVMGSLSDILNGNLGDLLSNSSDEDGEDGIISFTRVDDDDDDDDDEDDDDDDDDDDDELETVSVEDEDDDDDDDDDDEDEATEAVAIIKQWADSTGSSADSSPATSSSKTNNANTASTASAPKDVEKDALRQDCISALRKLSKQGQISPKQKQVLLTDIITCSAKGEFSMVEVAYELLCWEGEDEDAAEEFADQCRIFAHSLPESPGSSPSQQDRSL
jgi:hypothetical protein